MMILDGDNNLLEKSEIIESNELIKELSNNSN